jgi:hypothetical protein
MLISLLLEFRIQRLKYLNFIQQTGKSKQDVGELKFIAERQEAEIFQLGEEVIKLRNELFKETSKACIIQLINS